ncbi:hypothetical protein Tco_1576353 [Tanacetum coccineum]
MASLDDCLNLLFTFKECSFCGTLYNKECYCSSNQRHCFHCKDALGDGFLCRRCTCMRCGSGLSKGLCLICASRYGNNPNPNSLNDSQNISENVSQSPPPITQNCCYKCEEPLDGFFCHQCTCKSCGKGAHYGYNCPPQVLIISKLEPCNNQTVNEFPHTLPSVHPTSCSGDNNSFTYDSKPNFVDDSPNVFNPPPQPSTYSYSEELAEYTNTPNWNRPIVYYDDDDDEDYTIAITPILPTEEPINSPSMGDEHLDTISATESDEVIKSSVENLVPIPSESDGIPDSMCDVPLCNNPTPLEAFKEHSETILDSNNDYSLSDDDSYENIDYVDASLPDAEIVSLEVVEIVILESPSTFPNSFLEETNTFDNSLTESKTFRFNLEDIRSDSTTTHFDYSLLDYEAFYLDDDHIKEKSSGSTTTQSDISLSKYDSFIFDLLINPFSPADRSDLYHEEFPGELAHIISPPEYDHFCFKIEPELGNLTMDVVNDIFPTREPRVHVPNVLPTHLTLDMDFILLSEPLFAYIVWIFLPFLTYPVAPPYLLSCGNEDTIFDPGISIYHSFMPDVSHQSGTFMKFNTSDYFLEEFADELAHITFPLGNDDLPFDAESDLLELEYFLNHDPIKDMDSILEDSVDENSLDDVISEMVTDEHALDYSSPPLWDDYDDNLFDHETDNDNVYDDPFDFKKEKIKESKLLIDELDLPESNNVLPFLECDSVFYEDFSKVDALSSTNNEDKVFNLGIPIHENLFEVTNFTTPDKNLKKTTNASLIFEDFNPPLYELPFHKGSPGLEALLSFSSENEEKVYNLGILTSKRVPSLLLELSHRGTKAITKILESPMKIFPCSYQEDIRVLDVLCLHFYPP